MKDIAYTQVYNDILSKVLQLSEDPSQFADYLTQQIRELIGARTIVIAVKAESEPTKIFSVFPTRRTEWANQNEVLQLAELSIDFEKIQYLGQETSGEAIALLLKTLEIDKAIVIPLIAANRKVGSILLLDILDAFGIESVIDLLTRLSGVFALVIRNSILYQNMENLVAIRTNELRKKNIDLEDAKGQAEKSEMRTRDILQTAMDGFWMVDLKGKFIEVNDVACKMVGYTRKEMLKLAIFNLEIVESAEQTEKHLQKVIETGEDRFETKHRCKNGEKIDVELSVKIQRDQNLIVVFVRDITEKVQNEKRTEDLVERLRLSLEVSSAGTWDWDIPNSTFFWSDEFLKVFGMEPDTVPGFESWTKSLHPDDIETASKRLQDSIDEKTDLLSDYRILLPDGTQRWIRSTGKVTYQNEIPIRMIGLCLDVTEQKTVEEALKLSGQRYRFSLESTGQIGWSTPPDGVVEDMPMWREYSGQSLEEVVGWKWLDAVHPDDRESANLAWSTAAAQKINYFTEYRIRRADGVYRNFMVRGIPLLNTDGSCKEWVGTCIDITERKLAEETLVKSRMSLQEALEDSNRGRQTLLSVLEDQRRADKEIQRLNVELEHRVIERTSQLEAVNKELEAFSYSVSHDLRAPLRHINGFADILTKQYSDQLPEDARKHLYTIIGSAKKMGTLIDDLLSFSRTGRAELKKSTLKMNQVIEDALEQIKPSLKDRKIGWEISPLPEIHGDYNLLRLAWINLMDNAVKYTRNKEKAVIQIGYKEEKREIVFYIKDNGVGFDMKYAEKLFGVFQRLHSSSEFDGTGIGLANVHRIILRHGGRTWAEAETDKGATFYFSLPIIN